MSDNHGYGLEFSFGIDDGELDGLRPQECFVLGYELAMIRHKLEGKEGFDQMVHAENRDRIEAACKKACRPCRFQWHPADSSESWMQLEVEPS